MSRLKTVLLGALLLGAIILAVPAVIGALPDRYVVRFPAPLQKYGLPQTEIAVLPTVGAPNLAPSTQRHNIRASEAASPTPLSAATQSPKSENRPAAESESSAIEPSSVASPTAEPSPTLAPSATPEATSTPWPIPVAMRLDGFRHQFQTWNNCGPATLAMALSFFGEQATQEQTAAILKPDPEDRNVTPREMVSYVNQHTANRAHWRVNGSLDVLKRLLAHDIPVIVEIGIEPPGEFRWLGWYGHYLLLVAYDDQARQFWVYDSWFGTSEEPLQNSHPDGRVLSYEELESAWTQFNRTYMMLYRPGQESLVQELVGPDMDDTHMWQKALDRSLEEVEGNSGDAFNWFNLGTNYVALQQYTKAASAFDQARAIGLPWRMLWYQFGPYEAYLHTGRFQDVVLLANVTLQDRPYFEESYYYRGMAFAAMGDEQAAEDDLLEATRFNPNFAPAHTALQEIE